MACLALVVCGCGSQNRQQAKELSSFQRDELPPPSLQQPDPAAARESDVSPIPPAAPAPAPTPAPSAAARQSDVSPIPAAAAAPVRPPTPAAGDAAPAKMELLGEMSDSTPGAASVRKGPCELESCGVVLSIATHQAAESVNQDDGGPGLYMPQGMYSAETAGQPAVVDATGVQKIVTLWDVAVRMRDGTVQVIEQRNQPLFQVGDPVLVNGDSIQLWN